jgi:hypothetical protein
MDLAETLTKQQTENGKALRIFANGFLKVADFAKNSLKSRK